MMANEQTQTETVETDEQTQTEQISAEEIAEETKAVEKAVKSSEAFDKLIDEVGVEETPSDDDIEEESDEETVPETDTDDKDSGTVETKETDSKISDAMAERAIDLGLTTEEIEKFSDDADLEKTLKIIEDVVADNSDEPAPGTQAPVKKEVKEPVSILKFENEEDIDPEILSNMKTMEKTYQDTINKLSEQINSLQSGIQETQAKQFVARFDERIDKLGLEFADTFGKGPTDKLSKRSTAFRNRDAIRSRMFAFAKGLHDAGEPVPEEQQLFDIALNSLHGEKLAKVKSLQVSNKARNYVKGARMQRPSTKKASGNLTPQQKAVQTSKQFDDMIDTSEY